MAQIDAKKKQAAVIVLPEEDGDLTGWRSVIDSKIRQKSL